MREVARMSKMIAVCGAPGSGKTTAALKIAEEIYYAKKGSVIFLSPDLNVPCLAYIFPNCKEAELYSVGVALDRTDIYREDVLRQMNHVKTMENFGFLGYKAGENSFSYPKATEDKILNLFSLLKELADYVVVDCAGNADELISSMAKSHADRLIQLITPDLKCMAYYSSNAGMFEMSASNRIKVMNIADKDLFLPITEVANHFKGVDFTLPFSKALKQQTITGTLSERLPDAKYRSVAASIAKAVI